MDKDNDNSTFEFDNDPQFNLSFSQQIDQIWNENSTNQDKEQSKDKKIPEELKYQTVDENNQKENIPQMDRSKEDSGEIVQLNDEVHSEVAMASEHMNKEQNNSLDNSDEEIDIEDELADISNEIAKQICEDLDAQKEEVIPDKKRSKKFKILVGSLVGVMSLVLISSLLLFTKPGNDLLLKMGLNVGGAIWTTMTKDFDKDVVRGEDIDRLDEEDLASDSKEMDPSLLNWPEHSGSGRREEGVYNILILGEESIGNGVSRGRTDVIIIATLNTNTKKVKLTSILRDTLVQIPGYKENKINGVYEKGGIDLLYETISMNFNIHLDGSALVNFENFEKVIDHLGGVEITLTAGEARYLNSTNYISNPAYRNVKEGTQLLNGNQALGYSRIRKRATITGNNNDYGRTDRHRIVLNAIFEKYKTKSYADLAAMMYSVLPMVTTDIDSKTFQYMLQEFINMKTLQMDQIRIPADGTFTDQIKVRGMDVLVPDVSENIKILHEYIFGPTVNSVTEPMTGSTGADIGSATGSSGTGL